MAGASMRVDWSVHAPGTSIVSYATVPNNLPTVKPIYLWTGQVVPPSTVERAVVRCVAIQTISTRFG